MADKNWEVESVADNVQKLTYTELTDLARQIIAFHEDGARAVETIPPNEVDKMCRAILEGADSWREIYTAP